MDGDSYLAKNIHEQPVNVVFNDCNVCKSLWLRHHTISTDVLNRKFVESEFRFVLRSGFIFYIVYFLSQIF
jgi:hypothetical protein